MDKRKRMTITEGAGILAAYAVAHKADMRYENPEDAKQMAQALTRILGVRFNVTIWIRHSDRSHTYGVDSCND